MAGLTKDSHADLINAISRILIKNGLKATTMDSVAASLSMSKRTLYEIFDSKKDMILKVIAYWHQQHRIEMERYFATSKNVMEALLKSFYFHEQVMKEVNVEFFLDMDKYFPEVRKAFDTNDQIWIDKMMVAINMGIDQGVFRPDVNYHITLHLMRIQMESLKRMEEHFPPDITISMAFNSISLGFLRSIATPEGMKVIDDFYPQHPGLSENNTKNKNI